MTDFLFALAVGVLFAIGVFQLLRRDLIKAAMGFSMLFTAINLFILATGAYTGDVPPYTTNVEAGRAVSDPLVQALILTAVVVSFGSYALLLGLINIASRRYGSVDSDDISDLKR
ncbi:MAG: NADH-quinone oxidoreductase subunit K [Anaerolineae bacterium]|nr:NADH-quinone oxidoreductase subunit K [Anaerolineae bacterium]MCA9887631.1 NADH-quinone oxidoreductase subunit K [Anaerolineae bacterium]MCA9892877.1 NADH-quinone oxidoreductase subunit K [Anaerolineae bacterium]MCB9461857.1 NADH-quinone oxidoreductase subunit K [Anaerolineaceae bacterium]